MSEDLLLKEYFEKREKLLKANENLVGVVMREKEVLLDKYLDELKQEYIKSCNGAVPYDIPVLDDENLIGSRLYDFCKRLPKGADLHVHDLALLPAPELITFLQTCDEFCINADRTSFDLISVGENEEIPKGYMRLSKSVKTGYYTEKDLLNNWTTLGAENFDGGIWDYFENLFERHAVLSENSPFTERYYEYTFDYYCRMNIMHVEIHIMLTETLDESLDYLKKVRRAYYKTKEKYPYFTVRIIGAGVKADNENIEFTKKCFLNASYVQEVLKDEFDKENPKNFVIGFDLVNEEDTSLPLKEFVPMLLKVKRQYPDMKLFIHSGETLSASNENLIDAYLLGVSRVGHGFNLYRFPDLHSRFVKAEICLEVCPISNQRLGYAKDIRNHPATEYLKTGMPMALCSDDATYMERATLSDDFFAAIIGWDLKIADIKSLGINSIMYSGLENEEKFKSLSEYNKLWNNFVDDIIK